MSISDIVANKMEYLRLRLDAPEKPNELLAWALDKLTVMERPNFYKIYHTASGTKGILLEKHLKMCVPMANSYDTQICDDFIMVVDPDHSESEQDFKDYIDGLMYNEYPYIDSTSPFLDDILFLLSHTKGIELDRTVDCPSLWAYRSVSTGG